MMEKYQQEIADLLGRDVIIPDKRLMLACSRGKSILVTGAGGSIGSELCRQLVMQEAASIILFERSEYALYTIESELRDMVGKLAGAEHLKIVPVLGSIRNAALVQKTIQRYHVDTIYHAAAYKQVPMLERNVVAGIQNNIFGTLVMARAAQKQAVDNFIFISTDKAVRPVNVMGATKRFAEQIIQALDGQGGQTRFSVVRFGNVLGSSGSVIPLFRKQILNGGPVTVTHPDVSRYFMTVQEAAQLVIQAGALARGGDVFVLDMDKPVLIADMARKLVALMGFRVCDCKGPAPCSCERGIAIRYTGLREGEKLSEELLIGKTVSGTAHPKIMRALESFLPWDDLGNRLASLESACNAMDLQLGRDTLAGAVEGFGKGASVLEEHEFGILPAVADSLPDKELEPGGLSAVSH